MAGLSFRTHGPVNVSMNGMKGVFRWSGDFASASADMFNRAQKFVDSETLRYCDPMVPKVTGYLLTTGTLGTVIGSGVVRYIAIYARFQYYRTATTRSYDANRGGKWFERMKVKHKEDIVNGAKKIAGGR